jgi:hypothetical protein
MERFAISCFANGGQMDAVLDHPWLLGSIFGTVFAVAWSWAL